MRQPNTSELGDSPPVLHHHLLSDDGYANLGNKGRTTVDDRVRGFVNVGNRGLTEVNDRLRELTWKLRTLEEK